MSKPLTHRQKTFERGNWAEKLAIALLTMKGYSVLARRFRTRFAEIDLIVKRGRTIVFVEVKQRATRREGLESVRRAQQMRIAEAANVFLSTRNFVNPELRFDAIIIVPRRLPLHLENAWDYALERKNLS